MRNFKTVISAFILMVLANIAFSEGWQPKQLELSASFVPGFLLYGFQQELGVNSLTPKPSSFMSMHGNIDIKYYLLKYLGLEAAFSFLGNVDANSKEAKDSLNIYNYSLITGGITARFPIVTFNKIYNKQNIFVLYCGGGGVYPLYFTLAKAYQNLFSGSGFVFYNTNPDFGWYAKIGINQYVTNNIFFGFEIQLININARFDVSSKLLDGAYIQMPIMLGFSL